MKQNLKKQNLKCIETTWRYYPSGRVRRPRYIFRHTMQIVVNGAGHDSHADMHGTCMLPLLLQDQTLSLVPGINMKLSCREQAELEHALQQR